MDRWIRRVGAAAATAAGPVWMLAEWRWYRAVGHPGARQGFAEFLHQFGHESVHGLLHGSFHGGAELPFGVGLALMAVAVTALAVIARPGGLVTAVAILGAGGGLLGAFGNVAMSCAPFLREPLARLALDCGPHGAAVAAAGRVVFDGGLLVLAVALTRRRFLGTAGMLLALVVGTSIVTPLVGVAASRLGGSASVRAAELGMGVAHGVAWMGLGCLMVLRPTGGSEVERGRWR